MGGNQYDAENERQISCGIIIRGDDLYIDPRKCTGF
jgi:hypothetical protein